MKISPKVINSIVPLSLAAVNVLRMAVVALIRNNKGQILGVSRKHDHTDFGLVGGKVDPGETPEEALRREVKEETGLDVVSAKKIFERTDGPFLVICFETIATGTINSSEEGKVAWVNKQDLLNGSFGHYNSELFSHIG